MADTEIDMFSTFHLFAAFHFLVFSSRSLSISVRTKIEDEIKASLCLILIASLLLFGFEKFLSHLLRTWITFRCLTVFLFVSNIVSHSSAKCLPRTACRYLNKKERHIILAYSLR